MSIDRLLTDTITVQTVSESFGGGQTPSSDGDNLGYVRLLNESERTEDSQNKLFSTHRAVMTTTTSCSYGKYLIHNAVQYRVVSVNESTLDNEDIYIIDCELIQ